MMPGPNGFGFNQGNQPNGGMMGPRPVPPPKPGTMGPRPMLPPKPGMQNSATPQQANQNNSNDPFATTPQQRGFYQQLFMQLDKDKDRFVGRDEVLAYHSE